MWLHLSLPSLSVVHNVALITLLTALLLLSIHLKQHLLLCLCFKLGKRLLLPKVLPEQDEFTPLRVFNSLNSTMRCDLACC